MRLYFYTRELPERGSLNMAFDEFLLHASQKGGIHFRIYEWEVPTVSIGVNQSVSKTLDLNFIKSRSIPFVRRITGGKAVLHHNEITYAVASSEGLFFENPSPIFPYLLVAKALKLFLQKLGIEAELAQRHAPHLSRKNIACFSFPAEWEVKVKGRKIISGAMKRLRHSFMIHGTIPLNYNRELISKVTKTPLRLLERSFYSLTELISLPPKETLEKALLSAFAEFFSARIEEVHSKCFEKEILQIEEKYKSREWNFKIP